MFKNKVTNEQTKNVSFVDLKKGVLDSKAIITGTVGTGTDREMTATYTVTVIGLKDTKTGIVVANSNNTEMDESINLSVSYINEDTSYGATAARIQNAFTDFKIEDMQIFDINLIKDNVAVQPETQVDVEIPVSEDMFSQETEVYRLEEGGSLTDMEANYDEGSYVFKTGHFSIYVLGKKKPLIKIQSINIEPDAMKVCPGKTGALIATVLPQNADNLNVNWESSNPDIVMVSDYGKITALNEGKAFITASSKDGSGVKDTVAVTVCHSWNEGEITLYPTCTETGIITYACTEEGCTGTYTEKIEVIDHNYGDWVITDESTCIKNGSKEKICSRCGDKVVETLPLIEHTWREEYTVDKEAACEENGLESIHCLVCDSTKEGSERTIPKTGHFYGDWIKTKVETCVDSGTKERTCKNCNHKDVEIIPSIGHFWDTDYTVDQNPTCMAEGSKSIHCKNCDAKKDAVTMPSIEHYPGLSAEIVIKPATHKEDGYYDYVTYCSFCNIEIDRERITIPKLLSIPQTIALPKTLYRFTFNASNMQTQPITVSGARGELSYISSNSKAVYGKGGKIYVAKSAPVGTYTIQVSAKGTEDGEYEPSNTEIITVKVEKATNIIKVSPTTKKLKVTKVKKKAQFFNIKIKQAQGKVTYKSSNKKVKVTSKGKVTVKKGTKKGKYKITVTAAGNRNYNKAVKTVLVVVK